MLLGTSMGQVSYSFCCTLFRKSQRSVTMGLPGHPALFLQLGQMLVNATHGGNFKSLRELF